LLEISIDVMSKASSSFKIDFAFSVEISVDATFPGRDRLPVVVVGLVVEILLKASRKNSLRELRTAVSLHI
jgi:hypothetical protein